MPDNTTGAARRNLPASDRLCALASRFLAFARNDATASLRMKLLRYYGFSSSATNGLMSSKPTLPLPLTSAF